MATYPRVTVETRKVQKFLAEHFPNHPPCYAPKAYRYNSASIRVRLVDECFRGKNLVERHEIVKPTLRLLPAKTRFDISLILLLTPEEVDDSLANIEFENPEPLIFSNGRVRRK